MKVRFSPEKSNPMMLQRVVHEVEMQKDLSLKMRAIRASRIVIVGVSLDLTSICTDARAIIFTLRGLAQTGHAMGRKFHRRCFLAHSILR